MPGNITQLIATLGGGSLATSTELLARFIKYGFPCVSPLYRLRVGPCVAGARARLGFTFIRSLIAGWHIFGGI